MWFTLQIRINSHCAASVYRFYFTISSMRSSLNTHRSAVSPAVPALGLCESRHSGAGSLRCGVCALGHVSAARYERSAGRMPGCPSVSAHMPRPNQVSGGRGEPGTDTRQRFTYMHHHKIHVLRAIAGKHVDVSLSKIILANAYRNITPLYIF